MQAEVSSLDYKKKGEMPNPCETRLGKLGTDPHGILSRGEPSRNQKFPVRSDCLVFSYYGLKATDSPQHRISVCGGHEIYCKLEWGKG